jgi:hypothetical protein
MESFGSRTDEALQVCKGEIDECELFIGIYAWRYGFQPNKTGVSITEAEFDYARNQGKRCLCYVIDENHPWPPMLIDSPESESGRRLKDFKEKVGRLVRSKFTTPDNLARQISADLAREMSQQFLSRITSLSTSPSLGKTYCFKLAAELIKDKESTAHYVRLEGNDGGDAAFDLEQRFFDWLDVPDEGMLAILADTGSGKTTFCRHLCHKLASEWSESYFSFLPVLIPLRRYRSSATLSEMLIAEFRRLGGITDGFPNYSKLLIFLDGLDEQAERFSDDETSRRLFEVSETIPPESKVVLTCRTHFFRDRNVESKLLEKPNPFSTGLRVGRAKSIPIYYVLPFKEQQKEEYLRKTQGDAWQDMADSINKIYDLKDLSSRPILLNLITNLLPELRKTKGPVGERRLYDIAVDSWLERERWRGIQSEDVRGFLESIAFEMFKKLGDNHSIHHRNLQNHVMEHFKTKILSVVDLEAWDGMVRTSLFLNRDGDGNYAFMHRSFMEFFVADKIFKDWKNRKYDEVNSISSLDLTAEVKTFLKPLFSPTNIDILYFAVEDWKHNQSSNSASIFLRELPFPIPFGADSEHIDRLAESAANIDNMNVIETCLKVFVDLKIARVIPYLLLMIEKYVFIWDEIPITDNRRFIEYLMQKFDIAWLKTAKTEEIKKDKTIQASTEKNSLFLIHNYKETEAVLVIDDGRIIKFKAATENGKLIIYIENHVGDLAQYDILLAIAEIGDQSAIPRLEAIRKQIAEDVEWFQRTSGPNYEELKAVKYGIDDEFDRSKEDQLMDYKTEFMRGNAEDIVLNSIVWSYTGYYSPCGTWGFSCKDIDMAIITILWRESGIE